MLDRYEVIEFGEQLYAENVELKHQGCRNDLRSSRKDNTLKMLSAKYSMSQRSVSRYIRVHYFSEKLRELYLSSGIDFKAAVELSYLPENLQDYICCNTNDKKISLSFVKMLRDRYLQENQSDTTFIQRYSSYERGGLPNGRKLIQKYGLVEYSDSEITELLDKALLEYLVTDGKVKWH